MSGNLWMVSDLLDDEDLTMMQRDFITYYQGADYYGLGLKVFTRLAHEAGAGFVVFPAQIKEQALEVAGHKYVH